MSVNKAILIGRLGKDPELKRTQNDLAICNFSLATSEKRKDQTGSWVEQTEWHNVVVFGQVAENCARYLSKGREVFIEGKIQTRKWQDKEGQNRYTTEILANTVQFLGSKSESSSVGSATNNYGSVKQASGGEESFGGFDIKGQEAVFDDDDIPF
jgi:single-strand DNA-binding protein